MSVEQTLSLRVYEGHALPCSDIPIYRVTVIPIVDKIWGMFMSDFSLSTPIGDIGFCINENALDSIDFYSKGESAVSKTRLSALVSAQLHSYFTNPLTGFDIPLSAKGTAFQKRVWSALKKIPVGETRSYGELAKILKSSPRAVGNACRRNPIPIVIPCHRIVSASGIGGFAGEKEGENIRIKRWLLAHEGAIV